MRSSILLDAMRLWLPIGLGVTLAACQPDGPPSVAFGSAAPVGTWQPQSSASGGGQAQGGGGDPSNGMPGAGNGVPTAGVSGTASFGDAGGGNGGGGGGPTPDAGGGNGGGPAVDAGAGSADAGGSAGTGSTGALSSMTFSVLTHSQGGSYSPRNVGAIWVENSSGAFVKTLAAWAGQRLNHLTKFAAEAADNRVDAVTGATIGGHVTHTVTWNLKDVNGNAAPDGDYKVVVECTDRNSPAGAFNVASFTKGAMPQTITVPDATYFTGMKITLQ